MRLRTAGTIGLAGLFVLSVAACSPEPPPCTEPVMPAAVNGSAASEQDMAAAHDAVVRFQKQSDAFQTCLVKAVAEHRNNPPFFSRFRDDGFEQAAEDRKHDNQMQKEVVVGAFNDAVRTYNALHP